MKEYLKRLAHALFGDYQLNRIYCLDMADQPALSSERLRDGTVIQTIDSPQQIAASPDKRIRDHAWYAGEHAQGYGIWENGQLICMCWFWTPTRHGMPARFSRLSKKEAVMVDLLTTPPCRGKGYAVAITKFAARDLHNKGYSRLWTWVWHSNTPSIRVFAKAGWAYMHFLAEFKMPGTRSFLSFRVPPIGR